MPETPPPEPPPIVEIKGVTKRFGPVVAVEQVSLEIRPNEFFALLGPSGCGKTTLLRLLAGFETPDQGQILIDGQEMSAIPPNRRPVNMVFQSYALFPHMNVFDNVAYGLRVVKTPAREIGERVAEVLEMTRLSELSRRKPDQLSGGQRQRVALARALVKRPKVLLLDEPLSALDAKLREAMQMELVRLQATVGITFIIVTHDQNEALSMANRAAVMDRGRVRQIARPAELYEFPNCRFVADFIGKMNFFVGRVSRRIGDQAEIEVEGLGCLRVPITETDDCRENSEIGIAVRPEKVRIDRQPPTEGRIGFRGTVTQIAYFGGLSYVYLGFAAGPTIAAALYNQARSATPTIEVGEELWFSWDPRDILVLTR